MAWDEVHLRGYPRAGYEWVEAPIAPEWATGYYDYDRGLALVADSTRTSDAGSYYQIVSTRETNPGWTRRTLQSNYASRVAMNVTTFELDQSVATLNTGQIAAVTEVVKAWDRVSRGPQEPNDSSPTFVSENRTTSMHEVAHAFLHYAHVVAPLDPTVGVTTDTAASDWYQAWLLWTFRAVAHGASLLEVLQAFDRRVGVLRTCVRPPPTQILQRVQTTLRRISHSLRRHAPPPFRCEQHPRRGIEHDVTPSKLSDPRRNPQHRGPSEVSTTFFRNLHPDLRSQPASHRHGSRTQRRAVAGFPDLCRRSRHIARSRTAIQTCRARPRIESCPVRDASDSAWAERAACALPLHRERARPSLRARRHQEAEAHREEGH